MVVEASSERAMLFYSATLGIGRLLLIFPPRLGNCELNQC